MPSDKLLSKLPKETQKAIKSATEEGLKMHRNLKAAERKRMQKARDNLLKSLRSRLDVIIWLGDIDAFNRFLTQTEILLAYEQLKVIRDKGLQKEFEALLEKAGKI